MQELFDKARFGLAGMIGPDGTMDGGIFEYGGQWVRDSSNTALGALHAGQFEAARNVLQHMLTKMISQDGVTMIGGEFRYARPRAVRPGGGVVPFAPLLPGLDGR